MSGKTTNGKRQLGPERRKVAAVLHTYRREAEHTQAELAALCGWSRTKLAKIEASGRITVASFILWCQALKLDPLAALKRILNW